MSVLVTPSPQSPWTIPLASPLTAFPRSYYPHTIARASSLPILRPFSRHSIEESDIPMRECAWQSGAPATREGRVGDHFLLGNHRLRCARLWAHCRPDRRELIRRFADMSAADAHDWPSPPSCPFRVVRSPSVRPSAQDRHHTNKPTADSKDFQEHPTHAANAMNPWVRRPAGPGATQSSRRLTQNV